MNPGEINVIESRRQVLLGQLEAAEISLRNGLHAHGFGETVRAHMERAMAHICEAHLAIHELRTVRSVQHLVDDLNRIQQVMDKVQRGPSQHV